MLTKKHPGRLTQAHDALNTSDEEHVWETDYDSTPRSDVEEGGVPLNEHHYHKAFHRTMKNNPKIAFIKLEVHLAASVMFILGSVPFVFMPIPGVQKSISSGTRQFIEVSAGVTFLVGSILFCAVPLVSRAYHRDRLASFKSNKERRKRKRRVGSRRMPIKV